MPRLAVVAAGSMPRSASSALALSARRQAASAAPGSGGRVLPRWSTMAGTSSA